MKANSLTLPILEILQAANEPMSEYQLISALQQRITDFPNDLSSSQLALFQTHFLVMNALYQLQRSLLQDDIYLLISPLKICFESINASESSLPSSQGVDAKLSEYYLDWNNLENTSELDVDNLLNNFWQYYLADDKQLEALQLLELEQDCSWQQVQQAYRRKAGENHPDKGGDAATFMEIREAYEILRKARS